MYCTTLFQCQVPTKEDFPHIGHHLGSVSGDAVLSFLQDGTVNHGRKFEFFLSTVHILSQDYISNKFNASQQPCFLSRFSSCFFFQSLNNIYTYI